MPAYGDRDADDARRAEVGSMIRSALEKAGINPDFPPGWRRHPGGKSGLRPNGTATRRHVSRFPDWTGNGERPPDNRISRVPGVSEVCEACANAKIRRGR